MPGELFLGRKSGGLRQGGQLEEDIYQMSDPARRAQRLEETQGPAMEAVTGQNLQNFRDPDFAGKMQSITDMLTDQVMEKAKKTTDKKGARLKDLDTVEDRDEYMTTLGSEIKRIYTAAQKVKASETGNTAAYDTYIKVAETLIDRLKKIQDEGVMDLAKPPTTQPSEGL